MSRRDGPNGVVWTGFLEALPFHFAKATTASLLQPPTSELSPFVVTNLIDSIKIDHRPIPPAYPHLPASTANGRPLTQSACR